MHRPDAVPGGRGQAAVHGTSMLDQVVVGVGSAVASFR